MSEPLYDATRSESGIDPDHINFDGIAAKIPPVEPDGDYSGDMSATTVTSTRSLTAQDRCDRCGAQAYLVTEPVEGMELLFCGHHANEHREALGGSVTLDETSKLSETI